MDRICPCSTPTSGCVGWKANATELCVSASRSIQQLRGFVVANNPLASFIQTLDSIADREADILVEHGRPVQITYGYIRAALRKGPADIPAILAAALRRNSAGSVIVSTRKRERLGRYAEISDAVDKSATSTPADEAQ
jgi:hypothetical protein